MWNLVKQSLTDPIKAGEQILRDRQLYLIGAVVFIAGLILSISLYFLAYMPAYGPNFFALIFGSISIGFLWCVLWYVLSFAVYLVAKTVGGTGSIEDTLLTIGFSLIYVFYTPLALIFSGTSISLYIIGFFLFISIVMSVFWLCRVHRFSLFKGIVSFFIPTLVLYIIIEAMKAVSKLW